MCQVIPCIQTVTPVFMIDGGLRLLFASNESSYVRDDDVGKKSKAGVWIWGRADLGGLCVRRS